MFAEIYIYRAVATGGGPGEACLPPIPPLQFLNQKRSNRFQFQTSEVLYFTGAQKLYGPEISRFSPCMLQFLDNIQQLLIFSNNAVEIDHFSLDFLKMSDT